MAAILMPGPVAQGFGQLPQLMVTQGYQGTVVPPPPVFSAQRFEIEVGPELG